MQNVPDTVECSIRRWLEIATMTVDGIVSDVASQFLSEPGTAYMKSAMRPTLYRLQAILVRLQRGERVTASMMAQELDVSHRTIARDFDYLINRLHAPIEYDFARKSYVLTGPLPSVLTPPEQV
mgnify:CR=1 FL=1